MQEVLSYTEQFRTQAKNEVRNGVITVAGAGNITTSANIAAPTYQNVSLEGGNGTGARIQIKTTGAGGGEIISEIQWLDRGKNYQANDTLTIPNGLGNIGGDQITVNNIGNGVTVTLTEAITQDTTQNATWPNGTAPGQYNCAADGTPAGGGKN